MVASELYLVNVVGDELLQTVVQHDLFLASRGKHSSLQTACNILQRYGVSMDLEERVRSGESIPMTRESILQLKAAQVVKFVGTLTAKPIHKVYYQQASSAEGVDTEGTFAWLSDRRLRAETEGLVIAAQDGIILTNRYKHTVLGMDVSPTCRVCREETETIGHVMSSCKPHMWFLYKERHDRVIYQLLKAFAKKLEVVVPDSIKWGVDGWHGMAALERARAKIMVDMVVPTDRQLSDRRPDLILYLKGKQKIMILEGAVAWEPLLVERELQRADKYRELAADLATQHPQWRVVVVPIVIGCLGTLRSLRQNLYGLGLLTRREVDRLAKEIQFETLLFRSRLLRRHLAT